VENNLKQAIIGYNHILGGIFDGSQTIR
jgi:hypothetical protein